MLSDDAKVVKKKTKLEISTENYILCVMGE